jgi:hypothetical protein
MRCRHASGNLTQASREALMAAQRNTPIGRWWYRPGWRYLGGYGSTNHSVQMCQRRSVGGRRLMLQAFCASRTVPSSTVRATNKPKPTTVARPPLPLPGNDARRRPLSSVAGRKFLRWVRKRRVLSDNLNRATIIVIRHIPVRTCCVPAGGRNGLEETNEPPLVTPVTPNLKMMWYLVRSKGPTIRSIHSPYTTNQYVDLDPCSSTHSFLGRRNRTHTVASAGTSTLTRGPGSINRPRGVFTRP